MSIDITVAVCTKNRHDVLRDCLAAALRQTVPIELLVMNDASTDETEAIVRREFPQARLFTSDTSRGPTYQRNVAAREMTGRYLFTIDDDCVLIDPDTVRQTVALFNDDRLAAVTVPFTNILSDGLTRMINPDPKRCMVNFEYYGGMIAFRRDAYMAAGGYRESLFYYGEENDLSLRLMARGQFIRLGSAPPLHHMESPVRSSARIVQLSTRNAMLFATHNVPMPQALARWSGAAGLSAYKSWKRGELPSSLRGIVQGIRMSREGLRARDPVSQKLYRAYREFRRTQPLPLEEAVRLIENE